MNLTERAYRELFPESKADYIFRIKYSGRFKDYGANARLTGRVLEAALSRKWLNISEEIQIGLIQELILKLTKRRKDTVNIDLYNSFVKNLHLAIPKTKSDPVLESSFDRVNEQYFLGLVEKPNLKWGGWSSTVFGTYDFKTDTITISQVLKHTKVEYLDYVMFHEVLHKQHKFRKSGSKTYYHDRKFRQAERIFKNAEQLERSLSRVAVRAKLKAMFRKR